MKSIKTYLLQCINENEEANKLYDQISVLQDVNAFFNALVAIGFGDKDDDYIKLTQWKKGYSDTYYSSWLYNEGMGPKRFENILQKAIDPSHDIYSVWKGKEKHKGSIGSYGEYDVSVRNLKNNYTDIFTISINTEYETSGGYNTYTWRKSSRKKNEMLLGTIELSGPIYDMFAKNKYIQDAGKIKNEFLPTGTGSYWRNVSVSLEKEIVIVPNINKFKTNEEYKALILQAKKAHENDMGREEALSKLVDKLVSNGSVDKASPELVAKFLTDIVGV